jgi:hypothetical protein
MEVLQNSNDINSNDVNSNDVNENFFVKNKKSVVIGIVVLILVLILVVVIISICAVLQSKTKDSKYLKEIETSLQPFVSINEKQIESSNFNKWIIGFEKQTALELSPYGDISIKELHPLDVPTSQQWSFNLLSGFDIPENGEYYIQNIENMNYVLTLRSDSNLLSTKNLDLKNVLPQQKFTLQKSILNSSPEITVFTIINKATNKALGIDDLPKLMSNTEDENLIGKRGIGLVELDQEHLHLRAVLSKNNIAKFPKEKIKPIENEITETNEINEITETNEINETKEINEIRENDK